VRPQCASAQAAIGRVEGILIAETQFIEAWNFFTVLDGRLRCLLQH
jgi:hypothetical protein